MSNGDVLALTANSARIAGSFNAQDIYVDGNRIGEIGAAVLRDRRAFLKTVLCLLLRLLTSNRR